jgi:hypothetical protein
MSNKQLTSLLNKQQLCQDQTKSIKQLCPFKPKINKLSRKLSSAREYKQTPITGQKIASNNNFENRSLFLEDTRKEKLELKRLISANEAKRLANI